MPSRIAPVAVPRALGARAQPLSLAIACVLLFASAPSSAQVAAPGEHDGRYGDADSWRSKEFERDWGLGAINAHHAYARGLTGAGIALGQYDSGVALDHAEFAGRGHVSLSLGASGCISDPGVIVFRGPGRCFSTRGDAPTREFSFVYPARTAPYQYAGYGNHGTHVAGTMVAQRDGVGMHGVAMGSRLVTARFFGDTIYRWDQGADGTWKRAAIASSGVGGEAEVVTDFYRQLSAHGVRAANLEIWLPIANSPQANTLAAVEQTYRDYQSSYDAYMDGAIRHGIVNVVALGNDSGRIANIYPGMAAFRPEAQPYWLSVANVQRSGAGGYVISPSSSICAYTKDWCVAAPGTLINSTSIGGSLQGQIEGELSGEQALQIRLGQTKPVLNYADLSGTSMAAPHAIGAMGLLFERFPYLSGPQVRDVLLTTATDLGVAGVDQIYGWGLIDLKKAIDGPAQILKDSDVAMDRAAGGLKVWEGDAWDDWRNDIGGPGVLSKSGAGWLRLSGDNAFGGLKVKQGVLELTGDNRYPAQVEGGTLLVNGSLTSASLPVRAQGELAGSGRIVGDVLMQGRVSPGNSIGTLSVQGDYVQAAGSSYLVELASDGRADRIEVSGKATIEGGALQVAYAPGQYLLGQRFNVINAAGGVAGQFAALEQAWLSPFLKFGLSYAASQVDLSVVRGASFASVARTRNQLAAAAAADRLAVGQGLPQPLTQLFPEQALAALDGLSGEGYASLRSILLDDSRHLREAALVRTSNGGGWAGESDGEGDELRQGAWIELLKSGGTLDGDGNAARNEYRGSTTLLGYDYRFDGGWRLGALAGRGRIDSDNGRLDRGRVRATQFGLYGGRRWGGFGLSAGVAVARQSVELDRRIGFDGFADRTRASYDADTRQGFVEGAYRLQAGAWDFEPYAQLAQVRVNSDSFQENGGAAALNGRAAESRVDLSTLGLRFDVGLKGEQQDQSWLSLRGGLARRHAGGELTPQTQVAWRGGDSFSVAGAPLGEDATLVEAGLVARLSPSSLLELNYSGQFADEAHDHGINARYSLRF